MPGPLEACSCCSGRGYHTRYNRNRKSIYDPINVEVKCRKCHGLGTYRSDAA